MIIKEGNFISVIFYVRNSESYISDFLQEILKIIDDHFIHYELICMDNDSTDHTVEIVKRTVKNFKSEAILLNVIHLSECLSFEAAISTGIQFAIGDFIFEFDVPIIDYPSALIMKAYQTMLSDIDVVSISPDKKITIFQKGYYAFYNFGVHKNKRIEPERFRLISRRAINRVSEINHYYTLSAPVYKNCGLKTTALFYTPTKRYLKYDNDEFRQRFLKAIESIIVYTISFQKLLLYGTAVLILIGLIFAVGMQAVISLFFFLWAVIALVSCLILQYLSVLLNASYKNHIELIKSIEKVVK